MSRDVYVQDLPSGVTGPQDVPDDFAPEGLGLTHAMIVASARACGGDVDDADPTWVHWTGPGYEVELNLGDEPVDSFAMHCRGDFDLCGDRAAALLRFLGVRGFDIEDGARVIP